MVEGEETGGEEDEEESRPGQPWVEIRRHKWDVVNGDESQMNDVWMKIFLWFLHDSLH